MSKIIFSEEGHIYKCGDKSFTSVSRVLDLFSQDYPREHWLAYKAIQRMLPDFVDLRYEWIEGMKRSMNDPEMIDYMMPFIETRMPEFEMHKADLAAEWQKTNVKAINRGNAYHESRENSSYERGYEINPWDQKKYPTFMKERVKGTNTSLMDNLGDLKSGYYPELVLWNEEHEIAGQADKVFLEQVGKDMMFDMDDYKTNKKMSKTAFWYKNYGYIMLLPPVDHLQDSKLQKYELQLSFYAWMLEQQGLKLRNLSLHHLNQRYDLEYRKKEVEDMLEYREKILS